MLCPALNPSSTRAMSARPTLHVFSLMSRFDAPLRTAVAQQARPAVPPPAESYTAPVWSRLKGAPPISWYISEAEKWWDQGVDVKQLFERAARVLL